MRKGFALDDERLKNLGGGSYFKELLERIRNGRAADPLCVNAFLKELVENGITYDLQDVMKLEVPDVELPWRE